MATAGRSSTAKRLIKRRALRQGLLGGNRFWQFIWFAGAVRNMWSRVSKRGEAPIAFTEDLPEGEVFVISHSPERSRRGRGEGRALIVGPRRKRPRISSVAAGAAYAAARKALESTSASGRSVTDDRQAS